MNVYRQSIHHFARRQPQLQSSAKHSRLPYPVPRRVNALQSACYSFKTAEGRERAKVEAMKIKNVEAIEKVLHDIGGDPNEWSLEKLRDLGVMDHLIPQATLYQFTDCMKWGLLPTGRRTSFPLLRRDEWDFLMQPYNTWASAPWGQNRHSLMDKMNEEFYRDGHSGIHTTAKSQVLKAKLWNGMVPMSGARWREKKLDDPKNFQQFHDLMKEILGTFIMLNSEEAQGPLRKGYNWLAKEFGEFESAINQRRERTGVPERVDIKGMWAEYMRAVLDTMSHRTHQWLVDRVDEIQTKSKVEYETALYSAGSDEAAITAAGKTFFERVQDLNLAITQADFMLDIPMQGFNGYTPSATETRDLPLAVRQDAYYKLCDFKSWDSYIPFKDLENRGSALRDRDALMKVFDEGRKGRAQVRKEFRGVPMKLGAEPWAGILKSKIDRLLEGGDTLEQQTWGFVCYRLTYKQTKEEWNEFKRSFEAYLHKSGEWVQGAEDIKEFAGLQWVNGQEVGIPEGDIEAAKRHFATSQQSQTFLPRMWRMDFLVVDSFSFFSHKRQAPEEIGPYGDHGGNVRLIDPNTYSPEAIDQTSPGYTGSLRVLTSLVMHEIYPLITSIALRPAHLWPLARLHPRQVYVGPTVAAQEEVWDALRFYKAFAVPQMFDFIKKTQAEAKAAASESAESKA